jgi:hypothetical protein
MVWEGNSTVLEPTQTGGSSMSLLSIFEPSYLNAVRLLCAGGVEAEKAVGFIDSIERYLGRAQKLRARRLTSLGITEQQLHDWKVACRWWGARHASE